MLLSKIITRSPRVSNIHCTGRRLASNWFPVSRENGVAVIRMNKPPVNTFNKQAFVDLQDTIKELENDRNTGGLILTSSCNNVFSAGLDLAELSPDEAKLKEFWTAFESMWSTLYLTPLPTVAAINGACPALGAVLALSCDHRVMLNNERYIIGLNETALGMTPPKWLTAMCERTIGSTEIALQRGLFYTPADALNIGYIDDLAETEEELMEKSFDALGQMNAVGAEARAECKYNERRAVAEMSGAASVDYMIPRLMGDPFQSTLKKVLANLASKKKK